MLYISSILHLKIKVVELLQTSHCPMSELLSRLNAPNYTMYTHHATW